MDTIAIMIAKLTLLILGSVYILGLLMVWRYENRKLKMYREVAKTIEALHGFGLSMAVVHAKTFKIEQDYRQWVEMIDGRQQFIFEKVLFLRKSTLKTKYENSYNFQG